MDQVRETLIWAETIRSRTDVATWIKGIRQPRTSTSDDDTTSRRGSNASSNPDDAHKDWERARAHAILDGRMSFNEERRAVWEENPHYPFATRNGSIGRSSFATAATSTPNTSKVPVVDKPLGWYASSSSSSTSTIRPPHMKMKEAKPDAWLNNSPSLPAIPPSARTNSSSADSRLSFTPSDYAYRPSWLQEIEFGPYAHRTDAPPIARLYSGPRAQVRDHIAMNGTTIEFYSKSAQIQRPVEAHHGPEWSGSLEELRNVSLSRSEERPQQIQRPAEAHRAPERAGSSSEERSAGISFSGSEERSQQIQRPAEAHHSPERNGRSLEESSAEVLYGGSQERLQQIPLGLMALRQRELGTSYSSLPPPTSSGDSVFPPTYGTSIQGDLEKGSSKSGVVGAAEVGRGERVKRVVTSGKFWLVVMSVLLLVSIGVLVPLAVVYRR